MDNPLLPILQTIFNGLLVLVTGGMVVVLCRTRRDIERQTKVAETQANISADQAKIFAQQAALGFYGILREHHSAPQAELRRVVRENLQSHIVNAQAARKTLRDHNPEFHAQVSELANYFEALAMFLERNAEVLPKAVQDMMDEMLHNSVTQTWPRIYKYRKMINPGAADDWGGSAQRLYERLLQYRQSKGLA